ncbi:MAG: hypothetical protein O3A82_17970 [Verrucomicrobia bacterium]|nr:hypothetical protein [Verrucomicrobiota bacterium]
MKDMWFFRGKVLRKIAHLGLLLIYFLYGGCFLRGWAFGVYLYIHFGEHFGEHKFKSLFLLLVVSMSFLSGLVSLFLKEKSAAVFLIFYLSQLGYFLSLTWWTEFMWDFPSETLYLVAFIFECPLFVLMYFKEKAETEK